MSNQETFHKGEPAHVLRSIGNCAAQPAGERVKVARIKAGGGWHEVTDSKWIAEIFEADSIEYAIATIERIEK